LRLRLRRQSFLRGLRRRGRGQRIGLFDFVFCLQRCHDLAGNLDMDPGALVDADVGYSPAPPASSSAFTAEGNLDAQCNSLLAGNLAGNFRKEERQRNDSHL